MQVLRNVVHDPKLLPGGGATNMAVKAGFTKESLNIEWSFQALGGAMEAVTRTLP